MRCATILCLEHGESHFAASQEVYGSSAYDVITATNTASALVALKAIPRIVAAVLPCDKSTPEQQSRVAAELDAVKPGIPKFAIASAPRDSRRELLHLCYVESLQVLTRELGELVAAAKAAALRQETVAEPPGGLQQANQETRKLIKRALEDTKPPNQS